MEGTVVTPVDQSPALEEMKANLIKSDEYFRIDQEIFLKYPQYIDGNAFHDTLRGVREIKKYEVYQKRGCHEVACVINIGDKLNGHPGIVHGGIISTTFDNSYGWLFFALEIPPAFTVNLNVNFRKPVYENTTALLRAKVTEIKVGTPLQTSIHRVVLSLTRPPLQSFFRAVRFS